MQSHYRRVIMMKSIACRTLTIFLAIISVAALSGCADGKRSRSSMDASRLLRGEPGTLPKFDIPIEVNDRVIAWVEYFQGAGRKRFQLYLERSGRYIPMMRQILKEEGLPQDLVYISLIESGFSPHAYSRAHAAGLWQFIRSTGKMYGLSSDDWVDERRDPYKATRAAARLFRDLYKDYGDWYLAMVGYNAGPGRVKKAISITGSKNFWVMADDRNALRAETRDYVPKFIAAAIIAKMPEKFGFTNIEYHAPLDFDTYLLDSQTDLNVIAKCSNSDIEEIRWLNPHLVGGVTPPSGPTEIRIPKGTSESFGEKYAAIPREERVRIVHHIVKKGDTLSKIAKRYKVSINAVAVANNINRHGHLKRGMTLTIPVKGSVAAAAVAANDSSSSKSSSSTKKMSFHVVRAGETAGAIASKHGVTVSQLKSWNNLNKKAMVRAGQKLKLYVDVRTASSESPASSSPRQSGNASVSVHIVARGDTLGAIASKYGTSVKNLMEINGIDDPSKLRAGQKLSLASRAVSKEVPSSSPSETFAAESVQDVEPSASIPSVASITQNDSSNSESFFTYTIKPNETLGGIANRHKVSTSDLMKWNSIKNPRTLRAGTKIKIKGSSSPVYVGVAKSAPPKQIVVASASPAPEAIAHPTEEKLEVAELTPDLVYNVKSGDTLWGIARMHRVSIADIQRWNNLGDPSSVKPGTKLTIRKN